MYREISILSCLFFLLFPSWPVCTRAGDFVDTQELSEWAYFGEIDEIRKVLGDRDHYRQLRQKSYLHLNWLVLNASLGKHLEVIPFLIKEYDYPKDESEFEKLFESQDMSPELAKLLIAEIPGFVKKYGPLALTGSVKASKHDIVKLLLTTGVDPNTPGALGSATFLRDVSMVRLLVDAGADPYRAAGRQFPSPVEWAAKKKAASLLVILDLKGQYAELLKSLRKENSPRPDSPYIGIWVYRPQGGGFGSLSFALYDDGSATVGTDIGLAAAVWREQTNGVKVTLFNEKGELDPKQMLQLELVGESLQIKRDGRTAKGEVAVRWDPKQRETEKLYPLCSRLERACLTKSQELCIQINGRHWKVPIDQLIRGAQKSSVGQPLPENTIRWEDATRGSIPGEVSANAIAVPFVKRSTSPGYCSSLVGSVGHDHSTPADTKEGFDYTLFPENDRSDRGPFILLSQRPFPHGKNWLEIFFERSKKND